MEFIQFSAYLTNDTFPNKGAKLQSYPAMHIAILNMHSGICTFPEVLNFGTVVNLFSIVSKLSVTNTVKTVSAVNAD
jgi:hypothetical protein